MVWVIVLSNLIANATKYSAPDSAIEIDGSHAEGIARIVVRDRGVGLAPQMQSRVFNSFVQETQAIDRKPGGLGLGLSISRGLIELHGGSLRAASEGVGQGAEMIVELPAGDPDRRTPSEPVAPSGGVTRNMRRASMNASCKPADTSSHVMASLWPLISSAALSDTDTRNFDRLRCETRSIET